MKCPYCSETVRMTAWDQHSIDCETKKEILGRIKKNVEASLFDAGQENLAPLGDFDSDEVKSYHATKNAAEMLLEHQIDPNEIEGTGANGKITVSDVNDYLENIEE